MKYIILLIFAAALPLYFAESLNAMDKEAKVKNYREIVLAGGCFWCVEADFEKLDGVIKAVSGYSGGQVKNPSYKEVSSGTTGHVESVKIVYDPKKIKLEELLGYFWKHIDPTDKGGQFVDRGNQYRSIIFFMDENEKKIIEKSKSDLEKSGVFKKPIETEILPLSNFYEAEKYHQDYYKKNPIRYKFYRFNSGRDQFLEKVWKDRPEKKGKRMSWEKYIRPDDEELKKKLSKLQFDVVRNNATERPFKNEYWNNHEKGIYVDIVSGEPLFLSTDKFDSGTGWPSFTKPADESLIVKREDKSFFMTRTEVRSRYGDSHLGHLFNDGPAPTGLRYCINSASMRFIPEKEMESKGYGDYLEKLK